jgi:4-hydroxybenzoate polyprenyltransferase
MVNDLLDREHDRCHPVKSRRPIVSGLLPVPAAVTAAALILGAAMVGGFRLGTAFGGILLSYVALSILYSLVLKHLVIIDVMTIAACFVIRVAGGAAAVDAQVSHWLFVCTILLALFLGFGKRRHELVLLDAKAGHHRGILREYSPYFLDQMMAVVTSCTVVAYSLYTISPEVAGRLGTDKLPYTIPFVLYGIFRYLYLIHQREEGGSPSAILLADKPLLVNILLWGAAVIAILYDAT